MSAEVTGILGAHCNDTGPVNVPNNVMLMNPKGRSPSVLPSSKQFYVMGTDTLPMTISVVMCGHPMSPSIWMLWCCTAKK